MHTHSPKAGQGMNVSMQDSYNLGWKICAVVKGLAKRSILKTYQSERRCIAQDLIKFDHRFSRLFSGRPAKDTADEAGVSLVEFKSVFQKGAMFASGLSVDYGASMLVAKPGDSAEQGDGTKVGSTSRNSGKLAGKQELATNIKLGMRFPSFQVVNQSDACPWQFARFLKSDGRFRVILFAGNLEAQSQLKRVKKLCGALASENGFIQRFTPPGTKIDSVIEILTIHSGRRTEVELMRLPEILHPFDTSTGWDYEKVFVDDMSYHAGHGKAYENYGVDKERGCVIIVRPDQYVGWLGELEDVEDMGHYFSQILIPQKL